MKRLLEQWIQLKESHNTWLMKSRAMAEASLVKSESKQIFRNLTEVNPYATVFGRPQVGKTALILSLLGISPDHISELGRILRATIKGGNSSTSTSFIYKRSSNANFHISSIDLGIDKFVDADDLTLILQQIRDEIKSNRVFTTPVSISIPVDYFEACAEELSIIDIPGIDSKTNYEHTNLSSTLVNFVSLSSFIFIVEKVSHVADVGQLQIPLLGNWKNHTSKVALVLTHGFSTNSTKQKLAAQEGKISDEFVASLNERCVSGLRLPEGASLSVYRLDIADSLLRHPHRKEVEAYNSRMFVEMRREVRERRAIQSFHMDPIQEIRSKIESGVKDEIIALSSELDSLNNSMSRLNEKLTELRSAESFYKSSMEELNLPGFPEFHTFITCADLELEDIKTQDKDYVYDNYNSLLPRIKGHLNRRPEYKSLPSTLRQGFERRIQSQSKSFKQNAIKSFWAGRDSVYEKYLSKAEGLLESLESIYDAEIEKYETQIDAAAAEKKSALKLKQTEVRKLIKKGVEAEKEGKLRIENILNTKTTLEFDTHKELQGLDQHQMQYVLNLRSEIHLNLAAFKVEREAGKKILLFMLLFKQISQYKDIYERSKAKALRYSA